jgi:arabinofuranosyltransferase
MKHHITLTRLTAAAIFAVFAAETLLFVDWIPDDAFISFRYARNIADGLGPVFNPGERVEGASNPLWTALLALVSKAGLDTVVAAVTLSVASSLISLWLSLRLFDAVLTTKAETASARARRERRRFHGLRAVLILGLAVSFPMVFYATSGLETHAELVCLLLGTVFHFEARSRNDRRRLVFSQTSFLGAALLRPEGIMFLVVGAVFIAFAYRRRNFGAERGFGRAGWVAVVLPLIAYGVFVALKASYYGSFLPNTYLAKPGASIGYLAPLWRGWLYLVRFFLVSGQVLMLPFCAIAFTDASRRYACLFLGALVGAQLAFILLVGGDVLRFDRFTVAFSPFLLALALVGFIRLDALARVRSRRLSMAAAVLCVALMAGLNGGRIYLALNKTCIHDWMNSKVHRRIGVFLRENLPADATVVVNEVGAIAYESGLVTYDMIGLTDKTVGRLLYQSYLRFGDSGSEWSVPRIADYLLSRNPYCVVIPAYGEIDPDVHEPVGRLMHSIWEGVFIHPALARRYRCAFWIKIHDHKYWYFYFRNGASASAPPTEAPESGPCMTVHRHRPPP